MRRICRALLPPFCADGDQCREPDLLGQENMIAAARLGVCMVKSGIASSGPDVAPAEARDASPDAAKNGKSNVRLLRSHVRFSVNIRALLYLRDRFQTTTIRDISVGGAGLEGAYAVVPGDRIVLQLNNGRKVAAEVKWWACGRCGVAFESDISERDPLLIEGATGRSSKSRTSIAGLVPLRPGRT